MLVFAGRTAVARAREPGRVAGCGSGPAIASTDGGTTKISSPFWGDLRLNQRVTMNHTSGSTPPPATRLWSQLTFPSTAKIVTTFDTPGRLTSTQLKNASNTVLNQHDYQYNNRHARTKQTFTDASYVDYGYDHLGQLNSVQASVGDDFTYTSDAAWNLDTRVKNGTVTDNFDVGDRNQLTVAPGATPAYDAHGNLTSGPNSPAAASYEYDHEQQLKAVYVLGYWKNEFVYDGRQRLRVKKEYTSSGGAWVLTGETRYVYDGMTVVQERNSSNVPVVHYTRGLDLSGSREGAGGIGGLLARSSGYSAGNWSTHRFYHADGNGNVTYLIDNATSPVMKATYKYDPFGRPLSSSGTVRSGCEKDAVDCAARACSNSTCEETWLQSLCVCDDESFGADCSQGAPRACPVECM